MARTEEPREVSGVTTTLIVDYVERTYGRHTLAIVLDRAGVTDDVARLRDEHRWWSQRTKTALFAAAAAVTGDAAIARRVGEHVIRPVLSGTFRYPMMAEGSARSMFERIDRAAIRFSSIANLRAVAVGEDWAEISFWLDPPHEPTVFDCDYVQGLLSTVPRLFGRRYGQVRQRQCQLEGADRCVYAVTWVRDAADRSSSRELDTARNQLHALQDTVADLVSLGDLDELLTRIAERASIAIRAQRYLLAVRLGTDDQLRVRADGINARTATELADGLLDPTQPDDPNAVVVDIASRRRRYGRLAAFLPPGRTVYAAERDMLRAYARVASAALDSATALASARDERMTAEALLRVSNRLADCAVAEDVAMVTSEALREIVGAPASCVLLWQVSDEVRAVALRGDWPDRQRRRLEGLTAMPLARATWSEPRGVELLERAQPSRSPLHELPQVLGIARAAVVPIASGTTLQGAALGLWPMARDRPPVDILARLRGLAGQSSVAMARAELLRKVWRQASHDDLTGLPRRPLLDDRLGQALTRRRRTNEQLAVLFIDLDGFKAINDAHGHAIGDVVLQTIGRRMNTVVREVDTVARLGGDEFAVLLPEVAHVDDAILVAGKVGDAIALPITLDDGTVVSVGSSIGITCAGADASDVPSLLQQADQAMYAAKRAGGGWQLHTAVAARP